LSAIYHDVVKDRLYTDAANSPRRRSTQTAIYRLVTGLCQILSPVLVFTADEAWEFVPGKSDSVHVATWAATGLHRSSEEQAAWEGLFHLRDLALPELEKARQAKTIGKALEAKLRLTGKPDALAAATSHPEALRELLNVSQLELLKSDAPEIQVAVQKADGEKCERCWHWETDVGSNPDHPTICARCAKAVEEILAPRPAAA
jgi:isoleucyl-tRNA synthetase